MKRRRLKEEQIIAILREHEAGILVSELSRKHGFAESDLLPESLQNPRQRKRKRKRTASHQCPNEYRS